MRLYSRRHRGRLMAQGCRREWEMVMLVMLVGDETAERRWNSKCGDRESDLARNGAYTRHGSNE